MTINTLQESIAQAQAAAQAIVPANDTPSTALTTPTTAPGRRITMSEAMSQMGGAIDMYIVPDEGGIIINKDKMNMQEELRIELKVSDVVAYRSIRFGTPVTYRKSYDGITDAASRKPWANTIAECMAVDPKCRGDYMTVEPIFVLLDDVLKEKGPEKGKILAAKGTRLGWTSSITGAKVFASMFKPYQEKLDAGEISSDHYLQMTLCIRMAVGGGQSFGQLDFKNVKLADYSLYDVEMDQEATAA